MIELLVVVSDALDYETAIKEIHDYLSGLSDETFDKLLDDHKDGDFAVILRETGALLAHFATPHDEEKAWLIERRQDVSGEPPRYWAGGDFLGWTTDINDAIRFARREDALRVHDRHKGPILGYCNVVEHLWIDERHKEYSQKAVENIPDRASPPPAEPVGLGTFARTAAILAAEPDTGLRDALKAEIERLAIHSISVGPVNGPMKPERAILLEWALKAIDAALRGDMDKDSKK